jgi:SAM-dependent methyltransferase
MTMQSELTRRACPICGSVDDSRIFAESNFDPAKLDAFAFASRKLPEYMHHRLIECPVCDVLYASPAPAGRTLAEAYEQAEYDSAVESGYASRTYARFLGGICGRGERGAALDVGTGDGAFLGELRKFGFEKVVGIEPSLAPISAATAEVKPLIRQSFFCAEDFEPGTFNLITCFQTIEHLPDPMAMCRGALRLLKPGGALFLIAHNRRAISAKVLGRKSPIFDFEHLQLFSKRSAREMTDRAGFDRVRVWSFVNRYPLHYWTRLFPLRVGVKKRVIAVQKAIGIGYVPVPLPAGNIAVVGYRPRNGALIV